MVKTEIIQGYEAFQKYVGDLKGDECVNIYFTGTKTSSGKSWCPDCVTSEPCVKAGIEKAPKDSIFLQVEVGERSEWKDNNNPFRTDKNTRLLVIPTLLRWKSHQKLEGPQCEKEDLVEMFFTDNSDN